MKITPKLGPLADPETVLCLERVVQQAKNGELRWVGVITINTERETEYTFAGSMPLHEVIGAIEIIKLRINEEVQAIRVRG